MGLVRVESESVNNASELNENVFLGDKESSRIIDLTRARGLGGIERASRAPRVACAKK